MSQELNIDQKTFRYVIVSPVMLDKDTFEPFYNVTMRIYPEEAQDINVTKGPSEEASHVGRMLIDAITKAKSHSSIDPT